MPGSIPFVGAKGILVCEPCHVEWRGMRIDDKCWLCGETGRWGRLAPTMIGSSEYTYIEGVEVSYPWDGDE